MIVLRQDIIKSETTMAGETILVVESDKNLAKLIGQEFEEKGYSVLYAKTAHEIIDTYGRMINDGRIRGVTLEHFDLPGLKESNGELREILAQIPVIGHTSDHRCFVDDTSRPLFEQGVDTLLLKQHRTPAIMTYLMRNLIRKYGSRNGQVSQSPLTPQQPSYS